jgi:hypothetical protein
MFARLFIDRVADLHSHIAVGIASVLFLNPTFLGGGVTLDRFIRKV